MARRTESQDMNRRTPNSSGETPSSEWRSKWRYLPAPSRIPEMAVASTARLEGALWLVYASGQPDTRRSSRPPHSRNWPNAARWPFTVTRVLLSHLHSQSPPSVRIYFGAPRLTSAFRVISFGLPSMLSSVCILFDRIKIAWIFPLSSRCFTRQVR